MDAIESSRVPNGFAFTGLAWRIARPRSSMAQISLQRLAGSIRRRAVENGSMTLNALSLSSRFSFSGVGGAAVAPVGTVRASSLSESREGADHENTENSRRGVGIAARGHVGLCHAVEGRCEETGRSSGCVIRHPLRAGQRYP